MGVCPIAESEGNCRNPKRLKTIRKIQPVMNEMLVAAIEPPTLLASCAFAAV